MNGPRASFRLISYWNQDPASRLTSCWTRLFLYFSQMQGYLMEKKADNCLFARFDDPGIVSNNSVVDSMVNKL
jgi:hypothetical protein